MAIERYRSVADMPRPPRPPADRLLEHVAAAWDRAHIRAQPEVHPGVWRFRSVEEAQAQRAEWTRQRLRRLRAQDEAGQSR